MSYSRWVHSNWYTFWASRDQETYDSSIFEIMYIGPIVISFSSKDLRENMVDCLLEVATKTNATQEEIAELKKYINLFLMDVDNKFNKENKK